MYYIYKITNKINQKCYVGFTSGNLRSRFVEHLRRARNGANTFLHIAVREYGDENFIFTLLEEGRNKARGLKIRESHWISKVKPEYNMTNGGQGTFGVRRFGKENPFHGKHHTKKTKTILAKPKTLEHRNKLRKANEGKRLSVSQKKKIGDSIIKLYEDKNFRDRQRRAVPRGKTHHWYGLHRYGIDAPHFGHKHLRKTKNKISLARRLWEKNCHEQ